MVNQLVYYYTQAIEYYESIECEQKYCYFKLKLKNLWSKNIINKIMQNYGIVSKSEMNFENQTLQNTQQTEPTTGYLVTEPIDINNLNLNTNNVNSNSNQTVDINNTNLYSPRKSV